MSESLVGVIIGAGAAILGGIIAQILNYSLSVKSMKREEKKKAYEAAQMLLSNFESYNSRINDLSFQTKFSMQFKNATILLGLYAPQNIQVLFTRAYTILESGNEEISHQEYERACDDFNNAVRKDLGIE